MKGYQHTHAQNIFRCLHSWVVEHADPQEYSPQDAPRWSTEAPYPILDCGKTGFVLRVEGGGPRIIHEELLRNDKSLRGLTHRLLLPLWSLLQSSSAVVWPQIYAKPHFPSIHLPTRHCSRGCVRSSTSPVVHRGPSALFHPYHLLWTAYRISDHRGAILR